MKTCEQYQAEMLEHLYGLLEAEEARALVGHVQQCDACRPAMVQAEEQKTLLAAAAKEVFAGVRFEPPATVVAPQPAQPIVATIGRVGPQARRWRMRYAIAASIALIAGAVALGSVYWLGRASLLDEVAQADARRSEVTAERQTILQPRVALQDRAEKLNEDLRSAQQKQQEKIVAQERRVRDESISMTVFGLDSYQPGAPNKFTVETRNLNNQPVPAEVKPRIVNQAQEVVCAADRLRVVTKKDGAYEVSLPPDLEWKANQDLYVEFFAKSAMAKTELREQLKLSRPVYITHVATDKAMYQPGEAVYFRSLTLNRASLKPAEEDLRLHFAITSPKGDEVYKLAGGTQVIDEKKQPILGPDKKPVRGLGCGVFELPPELAGGEYTLTVSEALDRFPPESRKFIVNKYEKPRLEKKLEFTAKSYGPGSDVTAACTVKPSEGGRSVANQPVQASVNIDGKTYGVNGRIAKEPIQLKTDAQGAVNVRFKLPTQIDKGEASLAVTFTDGGSVETLVRPIPIVLKKLLVEFFPEGGDLVAGVPNRCYFQARTTLGKPAEMKGHIINTKELDVDKEVVAQVETLNDPKEPGVNQGMGRFEFTPEAGGKYVLRVDAPAGIQQLYQLPAIKDDGVVLKLESGVTTDKDPLKLVVTSAKKECSLLVGAYCRGRLLAHQTVEAKPGQPTPIELKPDSGLGGVYRITVFEDRSADNSNEFIPVAERLTYRIPTERLKLSVTTQRQKFIPGEKVLSVCQATNEKDQPQPAILMVAVVDQSVVNLADEKTHKLMPTHFFLTHEVKKPEDLEFADFMLTDHPKAPQALDLLLGVQGWRRFAEQDPEIFKKNYPEDAERYLAHLNYTPTVTDNRPVLENQVRARLQAETAEAVKEIQPEIVALQSKINETHTEMAKLEQTGQFRQQMARLHGVAATAERAYQAAVSGLAQYNDRWLSIGGVALGVVLVVVGTICLLVGFIRRGRTAVPYFLTAGCALLAVVAGLVWFNQFGGHEKLALFARSSDVQATSAPMDPNDFDALADADGAFPAPPGPGGAGGGWGLGRGDGRGNGAAQGWAKFAAPAAPWPDAKPEPAEERLRDKLAAPTPPRPDLARPEAGEDRPREAPPVAAAKPVPADRPPDPKAMNRPEEGKDARKLDLGEQRAAMKFNMKDKELNIGDRKKGEADDKRANKEDALMKRAQGLLKGKDAPVGEVRDQMAQRLGGVRLQEEMEKARARGGAELADLAYRRAIEVDGRFAGLKQRNFNQPAQPALGGVPAGTRPASRAAGGRPLGGQGRPVAGDELAYAEREALLPPAPPLIVREYRHAHSQTGSGKREDFTETLCWRPVVVLPDGKAQIDFELCDSVTSFEVLAYGHTLDGRLGAYRGVVESRLPFTVEPKIPIEISAGDKVGIPVTVANDTEDARPVKLGIDVHGLAVTGPASWTSKLSANQRTRHLFTMQPNISSGEAAITVNGTSEPFAADSILRKIQVTPEGFPIVVAKSDLLEGVARHEVVMPESWVNGTLKCQVQVYPSTLADLQKGLESLLREPNGCFEQTSSSNYPNLLILDYLRESDQANPELAKRARDLIERGYGKLVSFECQNTAKKQREGYEWFGGTAPPHEALTAYGLLQFTDLARVYPVDKQMVERTRTYLHSRRDSKGGFQRNPRALDSFGRAPDNITNAYIVWALTESGQESQVDNELATLRDQAKTSKDPYFLALVANALINRNQNNDAAELLKTLTTAQKPDGHLDAERTSITGSGGRDLQIETTSLAILAWLKANRPAEFNNNLQAGIKWLGQQRGGYGGFGATQSTIMALKALIAFTKANKKTAEAGELSLYVGDQLAGKLPFAAGAQEALEVAVKDADKFFKPGKNGVRVQITGNNSFPHTLSVTYNTIKPASAEGCAVKLDTKLDRNAANEGETVRLTATVENTSGKGQGMTVAIIGLPAGLTLPEDFKQLKDYTRLQNDDTEPGVISAWETRGRELILYWRDLGPEKKIDVNLDLICRVPGEYRGPASRAYLYYNADTKHWVDPLKIDIKARD